MSEMKHDPCEFYEPLDLTVNNTVQSEAPNQITFQATQNTEGNESRHFILASEIADPIAEPTKPTRRKVTQDDLAFGVFVRKLIDELLDHRLPITQQSQPRLLQIEEACRREFPQFTSRQVRLKIRSQLKTHRRSMKKVEEGNTFETSYKPLADKPRPILPWGAPVGQPPCASTGHIQTPSYEVHAKLKSVASDQGNKLTCTRPSVMAMDINCLNTGRVPNMLVDVGATTPDDNKQCPSLASEPNLRQNIIRQENNASVDITIPNMPSIAIFTGLPEQQQKVDHTITAPLLQQPNESLMPPLMNLGSLGSINGLNPLVIDVLKNLTGQTNDLNCSSDVSTSTNSPTNGISQTLFPTRLAFSSPTKSDLDFANLFQIISQMNTEMKTDPLSNTVDKEAVSNSNESGEPSSPNVPLNSNPAANLLATSLRMSAGLILQSAQLFEFVGLAAAAAHSLKSSTDPTGNGMQFASGNQTDLDTVNASPVGVE